MKKVIGFFVVTMFLCGGLMFSSPLIKLKVTAEIANIRQKPSIGSPIVRQFPQGALLEATSKEGEWYLVQFDPDESGVTSGYVHESLVMTLEEAAPAKVPPPVQPPVEEKPKVVEKAEKREPEKPKIPEVIVRPEPRTQELPPAHASLALGGGGIYAVVGDLNKAAQGLADLYSDQLGVSADQEITPVHITYLVGGELAIPLSSQFFISVGADYFHSKEESGLTFQEGLTTASLKVAPEITAVPIKLGLVFYPVSSLYFKVGASYYLAQCRYYYRFEQDYFWQEWAGEAKAQNIGFWGGLGFDLNLATNLAFFLEATSQFAPIKGFKGTGTVLTTYMVEPVSEEGTLYAFDATISSGHTYPMLFIRNKRPAEGGVENAREAEIDFTGIILKAGFRIKF